MKFALICIIACVVLVVIGLYRVNGIWRGMKDRWDTQEGPLGEW